ncbi:MAG: HEPN domain-containing protein [Vulcanococcus sp.]
MGVGILHRGFGGRGLGGCWIRGNGLLLHAGDLILEWVFAHGLGVQLTRTLRTGPVGRCWPRFRRVVAQAQLSAESGHHEWACFACHQATEKALKALHLRHGQQSWGHGLGRSFRDLPPGIAAELRRDLLWLDPGEPLV